MFQHLLPLTCTQACPANAPAHSTALWMDTEMFEEPREAVTCTRTALPRIWAEPLKATPWCKERAKGVRTKGEPKAGQHQGQFLLMPKLLPPSAAVAGIFSQLDCRSHLGPHGDFSSFRGSGRAEGRRHGWTTVPCTAQGTEGNRAAHPNSSFPHTVSTWALPGCSRAGGARRLCWKHIRRHPQVLWCSSALCNRQRLHWVGTGAWKLPSEESNQRTHPIGNNLVGEIQVFFFWNQVPGWVYYVAYTDVTALHIRGANSS